MSQRAKDFFGIAAWVAAAAVFIGMHSWIFVQ